MIGARLTYKASYLCNFRKNSLIILVPHGSSLTVKALSFVTSELYSLQPSHRSTCGYRAEDSVRSLAITPIFFVECDLVGFMAANVPNLIHEKKTGKKKKKNTHTDIYKRDGVLEASPKTK